MWWGPWGRVPAGYEPLPFVRYNTASSADMEAQSNSRAGMRPRQFRVGSFEVPAPPRTPARAALEWESRATGGSPTGMSWLDTTYLDADLRISRTSNGDLFVLKRDDPNDGPDT